MKQLTHRQKLAMAWRATHPAFRGYLAGKKSVLAFRRSRLHMLPLTALSHRELHLRIQQGRQEQACVALRTSGLDVAMTSQAYPWGVAFSKQFGPVVVHLHDAARGITTPDTGEQLDPRDFPRRFVAAQAVAARLNALATLKKPASDKENAHD